jgi:hypothetical protein
MGYPFFSICKSNYSVIDPKSYQLTQERIRDLKIIILKLE